MDVMLFWLDFFLFLNFPPGSGTPALMEAIVIIVVGSATDAAQGAAAVALTDNRVWARMDVPVDTRMRRAAVADGILVGFRGYPSGQR